MFECLSVQQKYGILSPEIPSDRKRDGMSILEILRKLVLGPIELLLDALFSFAMQFFHSPGVSIIVLSLAVNLLLLPLYRRADTLQKEERDLTARMQPRIDQIRRSFTGDERFMILKTFYRQNNYKPWHALKGSLSLLLQIPFFIAAYAFLSNLKLLQGVSFGPIRDLSLPDGLLVLGSHSFNLLPILMTAINVVSGIIYTRGMPLKSKIQLYGMALLFLVLLYNSPSGLVFYWTLNNLFSLVKNLLTVNHHRQAPAPQAKPAEDKRRKWIFYFSGILLALLTGLLIPSAIIKESPAEFIRADHYVSPLRYLLSSSLLSFGTFVLWSTVFYKLSGAKARKAFAAVFACLAAAASVSYMFFGSGYGNMSSLLRYDAPVSPEVSQILLNLLALLAAVGVICFLVRKFPSLVQTVCLAGCLAVAAMSVLNVSAIRAKAEEIRTVTASQENQQPSLRLSKNGKNVVVVMLDRAISGFVPYLMNEKPELLEQFDGFTYYPNTLSYGFHTNVGSPALFGGYEYTPDGMESRPEKLLVEKHNEALKLMPEIFLREGYDITVFDVPYGNYQWITDLSIYDDHPEIRHFNAQGFFTEDKQATDDYRDHILNRNLFCHSLFRSSPVLLHRTLYNAGNYRETDALAKQDEDSLQNVDSVFLDAYRLLENLGYITEITDNPSGSLFMMASDITHNVTDLQEPDYIPSGSIDNSVRDIEYRFRPAADGSVLDMNGGTGDTKAHYRSNMAALLLLGRWFDVLREQGVYDNTRIILVSDHGFDLGLFGYELADKYRELPASDFTHQEHWSDTMGYNAFLMVKDYNAKGFTTDNTFMTNADTPILAFDQIVRDPVNPFTGVPVTDSKKDEPEQHIVETEYDTTINNGTTYLSPIHITLKDRNLFDPDNWSVDGALGIGGCAFVFLYIDPGTGSMLFTILIGVLGIAIYAFRSLWMKLKFLFSGGKNKAGNKDREEMVFFTDSGRYWAIFKPLCDEMEKRKQKVLYLTASPDDPMLKESFEYIRTEFAGAGNKTYARMNFIRADIVFSSTPGLDVYQWKRSRDARFYIHAIHAANDAAIRYRMFGTDYFDAVLVSGEYQIKQIRELERIRNLPAKELVDAGLPHMDFLLDKKNKNPSPEHETTILLAPSWGLSSILNRYGEKMIQSLIETGYHLILRPHPQSKTSEADLLQTLQRQFPDSEQIEWNFDDDNFDALNKSDLLISDFSGVIFDFALVFEKPVIYTEWAFNKDPYDAGWLEEKPWTFSILPEIGMELNPDNFDNLKDMIRICLTDKRYEAGREKAKAETWTHIGKSVETFADYLISKKAP